MSLIGNLKDLVSGKKLETPVLLKQVDDENCQLNDLRSLLDEVSDDQREKIETQINLVSRGLKGERNIEYELKNSDLPLISLHDINLTLDDRASQIDFVVVTKKCIFVIESKNLFGQMKIEGDDFYREYRSKDNNVYKKERIYSPVSQNEKHVSLLKRILEKEGLKNFPILSIVVISDEKTIIEKRWASEDVKRVVISYDTLKKKMLSMMDEITDEISGTEVYEIANVILANDIGYKTYYIDSLELKFGKNKEEVKETTTEVKEENIVLVNPNIEEKPKEDNKANDSLYETLRSWRYKKSQELYLKPYFIFNNDELSDLIIKLPKNKDELLNVNGFGEIKVKNYGDEILAIINKESSLKNDNQDNDEKLIEELKSYRLNKANKFNLKPYFVFTNEALDEFVQNKPVSKEEFLKIKGMDEKKYQYNGKEIIDIISKYK